MVAHLGLGTFSGAWNNKTDTMYVAVLEMAIKNGCQFIDSSPVYREGRSLRCIQRAFSNLSRNNFCLKSKPKVCIKIGFNNSLTNTFASQDLPRKAMGGHCLEKQFLRKEIIKTLEDLDGVAIDILMLHNPEVQLTMVSREQFFFDLKNAFNLLEEFRSQKLIESYGIATTKCLQVPPSHKQHLTLKQILRIAEDVAGSNNGFSSLMGPLSIDAQELVLPNRERPDNILSSTFVQAQRKGLLTIGVSPITPFKDYEVPLHPALAKIALKWALLQASVNIVVCSTLKLEHLKSNFDIWKRLQKSII